MELAPKTVLESDDIRRALKRMAGEIVERNKGLAKVALVGVRRGGEPLAARLRALLAETEGVTVPVGSVDITLYRDDAASALPNPLIGRTDLPFAVDDHVVVLVDDVLYTGRTVRAALDAMLDYGRPRAVQLAVLVDRGHRELPIQADFVGKSLPTARGERIEVIVDGEGPDRVVLTRPDRP